MTNEETKAKLINIWQKSTSVINKRNLKKCAGAVVIVAVFGSGASYVVHQNKAEAKRAASEARTQLLQNMAAQEGRHVITTQEAQEVVAKALNTDASALKFSKVNLLSKAASLEKHKEDNDKHEKREKGHGKELKDKAQQFTQLYKQDKNRASSGQAQNMPGQQVLPQQPLQQAAPVPQQPQTDAALPNGQPGKLTATMPVQPRLQPLFYQISCTQNNVEYKFLLNAENGKILSSQVEPAHAFAGLLPK